MKISVLMSVYGNDRADHLQQALSSIYEEQTRKPDEIVVVFDGPLTDELYAVLDGFKQNTPITVTYVALEENRGLGEALRIGSLQCTGDYICRMDADDISHSQRFEKQVAYLTAHPDVDVVGTDIAEFYDSPDEGNLRVRACPAAHEDILHMCKKRNPMNHVTVCMKREALVRCGGYESLLLLEDYYLWLRMLTDGCTFGNVNESLVYVRIGNGFHSKRGSKIRIKGWRVLQDYMLQHGMITRAEARMNMIYIRGFTYCPGWLRKIVYDKLLRK